ncbi:sodium:solute symporter family protein [Paremcibacter congregatus]|uniref:sodium:solute symporter family protein n=1 Tax=Paremcibacter congregatus TaxID=2043170 RepID=UPI003A8EDB8A
MQLSALDWGIIITVLSTTLLVGFWVSKRASANSASYFLGGRHMPWWLLGTSMVATTFAADTPNLVTNIVRTNGVSGNWVWWSFLITGMLTTFVYAKLWRRLGVTTDVEFYERRYSGKAARFLRGFRALYLGFFFNIMIMANVTLAAIKIGSVMLGLSPAEIVIGAGLLTVIFSAAGGFLGVLITDMLLFVLAMTGSLLAAYFAVNHPAVGGLDNLLSHPNVVGSISILPDLGNPEHYVPLLLIPLVVQWWSAWYPGAEPGGGGYIAQRMLAAKNENHAVACSAFFNFCHYAVRPWPWILVALASLIVYPDLASIETAFPDVDKGLIAHDLAYSGMLTYLPHGILGIVVASLASAYVSTISTSLNWGSSYYVNDFYLRFINPDASGRRQVFMGRVMTVVLMVIAGFMSLVLESALQAFQILLSIGAGTGLLFLLRWFWTRINVWSEVSAMVLSFLISMFFQFGHRLFGAGTGFGDFLISLESWERMVYSVALTTVGWVSVTLMTRNTSAETLATFKEDIKGADGEIRHGIYATLFSTAAIYGAMFAVGNLIYGNIGVAVSLLLVTVIAGYATWHLYCKAGAGARLTPAKQTS